MTDHAARSSRPHHRAAPAIRTLTAAAVLALAAAGCTGGSGASPGVTLLASVPPSTAPGPSDEPATGAPGDVVPQAIIDNAIADASERSGADPAEVTVAAAEAHDWPNGGLGCPEPGMMYTEVITPGYRVVVEANGTQYDYRASTRSSDVRWCENPPPAA